MTKNGHSVTKVVICFPKSGNYTLNIVAYSTFIYLNTLLDDNLSLGPSGLDRGQDYDNSATISFPMICMIYLAWSPVKVIVWK